MKHWTPEEMAEGEDFTADEAKEALDELAEEKSFMRKRNDKYYIPNRRVPWAVKFIMKNR